MDFKRRIGDFLALFHLSSKEEKVLLVCQLFNDILNMKLKEEHLSFLYYISNMIGVPQYFHMLLRKKHIIYELNDNLYNLEALFNETNLLFEENKYYHIFQKEIVELFNNSKENRYLITAPTSFGKTTVIYNIIKKMKYKRICLIFPTISLLMENLCKVNDYLINENNNIQIITLSEENIESDEYICIFTPERFMSFIDKNPNITFEYVFMDEIYKLDNFVIRENETKIENDRDLSFRITLEIVCKKTKDLFLAGPYLNILINGSFDKFLKINKITLLDYNNVELVSKRIYSLETIKEKYKITSKAKDLTKKEKIYLTNILLNDLGNSQTIVYCEGKASAEKYCYAYLENMENQAEINVHGKSERFNLFIEHIRNEFSEDWILYKAMVKGVGIHHGTIPKYIQKEIINLFEIGDLNVLFTTTTITEGVNTNAENLIVLSGMKGKKFLHVFDAKNIVGRAGRFNNYYSGNIYILDSLFDNILNENVECIEHIDYDKTSEKEEQDILICDSIFLSENQLTKKNEILSSASEISLPEEIKNSFLSIKLSLKIKLYSTLKELSLDKKTSLRKAVTNIRPYNYFIDDIETVISYIEPIIEGSSPLFYLMNKNVNSGYRNISGLLEAYLINGLKGQVDYYIINHNSTYDNAFRKCANLIYNTFRYELVKYLGLLDIIYSKIMYDELGQEVEGLSSLLSYLEYGCYSPEAKKASDFGVPFKVVKIIDGKTTQKMDTYELECYNNFKKINNK